VAAEQPFASTGHMESERDKETGQLSLASKPKVGIIGDDGITERIRSYLILLYSGDEENENKG
jgi:hypothetical protein